MKTTVLIAGFLITALTGFSPVKSAPAPAVAGWYFRAIGAYPAGVSFEPVVLFANGQYVEVGDEPVENLDVTKDKASRPKAWGIWKKNGNAFTLTNYKGKPHDYKLGTGSWFPAYAYSASQKLKPSYTKTSGGSYGNGVASLSINKISFTDASHFTQGLNGGATAPNASIGSKKSLSGTYKVAAHSITFTYSDGRVVKKSFALGAKGTPPSPDTKLVFIGGDPFVYMD